MTPDLDLLAALGHVDPPPTAVLDAAREALWSAVAHEMLAADPSAGESADPARARQSPAPGADRRSAAPDWTP